MLVSIINQWSLMHHKKLCMLLWKLVLCPLNTSNFVIDLLVARWEKFQPDAGNQISALLLQRWLEYINQVNATWLNSRSTQYAILFDINSLQCNQIQFTSPATS